MNALERADLAVRVLNIRGGRPISEELRKAAEKQLLVILAPAVRAEPTFDYTDDKLPGSIGTILPIDMGKVMGPSRREIEEAIKQRLGGDKRPEWSRGASIETVVRKYMGLSPDDALERAVYTNIDQFYVTVDIRDLLRALGGEYEQFAKRVEENVETMRRNAKAYLAGAGVELGKEKG